MAAQALARMEGGPAEVGEAPTEPELLAAQKLLAEAAKEGYPEALERAARAGLLKLAQRPSRAKADFLHSLLADRSIGAAGGNPTCRTAAAEALVAMGFPYALEIAPEDLALLKRTPRMGKKARRVLALLSALGGAGVVLAVVISAFTHGHWEPAGSIAALAGASGVLGGTLGELFCPPGTDAYKLSRRVVFLALFASAVTTYFVSPLCVVPLVSGVLAESLTRPERDKP